MVVPELIQFFMYYNCILVTSNKGIFSVCKIPECSELKSSIVKLKKLGHLKIISR